jgi:hypothetical protein
MSLETFGSLLLFILWFVLWVPIVALGEYGTHRWIQHKANRVLDPKLSHLKSHGTHHRGTNDHEFVDAQVTDCLSVMSPAFVLLVLWGVALGSISKVVIPVAALLAWNFVYAYLWTRIHRAIHGTETNWFQRSGPLFRFYRDHHLKHHVDGTSRYGAVFPWTDYLFFSWRGRNAAPAGTARDGDASRPERRRAYNGDVEGRREPSCTLPSDVPARPGEPR